MSLRLRPVWSFPAVSTSGRLAFSRRDLNVDMFVLTGSSEPRRLAASTYNEFDASFSADGSKVAFATDRTGDGNEIWVVNSDGSGRRPLTRGTRKPEGSPRWSPDGTRLAFDGVGDDGQRRVFVIDQAGGAIRAIPGRPGHFDQVPSWSRDGKWLYFGSNRSGESEIWRVAADGSGPRQMTSKGGGVPFESPDGRTLYYSKPVPGGRRVFARPVEGGEERSLGVDVVFWNYFVSDGGLYYTALPEGRRAPFSYELRLLDDSGRTTVPQGWDAARTRVSFGVRDKLMADRLSLTLRIIEPFSMSGERSATIDPAFTQLNQRWRPRRALQLSATWTFGRPRKKRDEPIDLNAEG